MRLLLRPGWLLAATLAWGTTAWAGDIAAAGTAHPLTKPTTNSPAAMDNPSRKSEQDWKKQLSPEQYRVLRQKGTERAFTGAFWDHHEKGTYLCAGCGQELFSSTNKFDSGCGWPSYTQPMAGDRVAEHPDHSHGMIRTEVTCARCGGHLGHVFNDGPGPTGLRYCINSVSLAFATNKPGATATAPPRSQTGTTPASSPPKAP